MKIGMFLLLISSYVFAGPTSQKRILPVTKEDEAARQAKIQAIKNEAAGKKEEDCDDKAKKPIEIKPESISLTGNAGCTLDEAH